jgi:DNA invertase Pin-like site-specific DNA recombinase
MIKVAGYGRMSTDKQQMSPKVQTDKIEQWVKQQQSVGKWKDGAKFIGMFIDEAVSSRVDMLKRPFGQHVVTVLDPGDMVVVASLSRAFRSVNDTWNTMRVLDEAGISIAFLDSPMDTSTPVGKLMLTMVAGFAEFERDLISTRTKDTAAVKRKLGEPIGPAPVGWRNMKDKRGCYMTPDKTIRTVASAAANLFQQGNSRESVFLKMRAAMCKRNLQPKSHQWYVTAAAASCLDFPKQSIRFVSSVLGFDVDRMSFVTHGNHGDARRQLSEWLKQEGFKDAP